MSERRKRNIIICTLCGVLLLMVVGYAAFNTLLNINGTTSITSNWDIKITSITSKDVVGGATDEESQVVDDLSATFKVNLVSPGDSITYYITVENNGNLDAEVARVKISEPENDAIIFETNGIEEGEILTANGGTDILTVKVTYSDNVTSQPESLEADLRVTLDYVQKDHKSEWIPTDGLTSNDLIKKVVSDGDGLYADSYESGRYIYKGGNPNNYITFNNEVAGWRIIGIEDDGIIKIMRASVLPNMAFDNSGARTTGFCSNSILQGSWKGCSVWAETPTFQNHNGLSGNVSLDSSLKIYLNNTYYEGLEANKSAIQNHKFYYGPVVYNDNTNLSSQITNEKMYSAVSNIGLIQVSDYIKANTNEQLCGNLSLTNKNYYSTCNATQWMDYGNNYWTIAPWYNSGGHNCDNSSGVIPVTRAGDLSGFNANSTDNGVVPSIYLKADTKLSGNGTEEKPYTITNYIE